jgi:tetratricopeptide (TPR) repeat protein
MKKINMKTLLFSMLVILILLEIGFLLLKRQSSFIESEVFKINFHAKKHRILCLGESTTEGGYPHVLQSRLDLLYPGKYHVYDFGRTAVSSFYFKRNIEKILDLVKPQTVLSMLGINDNFMLSQVISSDPAWYEKFLSYRLILMLGDLKNNSLEQQALRLINANKDGAFLLKILHSFNYLSLPGSYMTLADYYEQEEKDYSKALEIFNIAIEKFPKDMDMRFNRLWSLNELPNQKTLLDSELIFFSLLEKHFDDLAHFYLSARENKDLAKNFYKKSEALGLISKRNRIIYSNLLSLGEDDTFNNLSNHLTSGPSYYLEEARLTPSLVDNLKFIFAHIASANAKSIVMSYPLRTVIPSKELFGNRNTYLDNELIFKKSLEIFPYSKIFKDSFAGDFGHLTDKGKELMVDNIMTLFTK